MSTRIRLSAFCTLALLAATASGILGAEPEESGSSDATPAGAAPDTPTPETEQAGATEPRAADKLSVDQQQIADDFQHFQDLILRMAELSQWTDPHRAALLRRAVRQSQEKLIGVQLESLVEMLEKDRLSRAIENQDQLYQDLEALLDLLLSEDRARRAESEKARIRQYLKRLNQIINQQKSIQGRTAGTSPPGPLAEEQQKLADKTGDLGKDIKEHEEPTPGSAQDQQPKSTQADDQRDGKPGGEGKKTDPREGEGKEREKGEPQDKEKGEGKGQPSEAGKAKSAERSPDSQPGQAEGQPGKPQGKSQPGQQPQGQATQPQNANENPARQRIEAAEERMRQAEEELRQAEREGAVEEQEQAIQELEKAKAELERILRQLREEERERMLTTLQTRFKKMLDMQTEVYEGTVRLDKIPEEERTYNQEIEASRLSRKEAEIVLEADTALAVLRDDGTAVAFPEALEQARDDMRQIVRRLDRAEVGPLTQTIEEDVISALKEMIEALEQAKQDQDAERQRPMQAMPTQPQDQPLVDLLAEIKMIRAMQMRVNRRTERYSKLIEGEQAEAPELLDALKGLAGRQERIHQITRDLQTGGSQ